MKVTKGIIKDIAHQVLKELKEGSDDDPPQWTQEDEDLATLSDRQAREMAGDEVDYDEDGYVALKDMVWAMANGNVPLTASREDIITAFQLYYEGRYLQAAGELRKKSFKEYDCEDN